MRPETFLLGNNKLCGKIASLARIIFGTAQKMKFSIEDFSSKCDSHLLKKSLTENLIFCAV